MCEMMEVSRQGYYAWKKRVPSARQKEDVTLTTLIDFVPEAKDQLWYGDITYIFTMSGWVYQAT
jgi:putative transposase